MDTHFLNTNVLIVEDDPHISAYIASALEKASWCKNIVITNQLKSAHKKIDRIQFQLMFVDIGLPDGSGLDIIRRARRLPNKPCSVVMTIFDDEETVITAIKTGASSYLVKDVLPKDILTISQDVLSGRSHISARIAHYLIHEVQKNNDAEEFTEAVNLTPREKEILDYVARGYSSYQVADLLTISYHTVASHIKNIYQKLQVSSRSEAIFEAHKQGLIRM